MKLSSPLLDTEQAAAHLGVTIGTLNVWRSTGRHQLPYLKIGRNVRYRLSDLDVWLEARLRTSV